MKYLKRFNESVYSKHKDIIALAISKNINGVPFKEIKDRIIEFDVIKGDNIDMISLNNLFDYYNATFNSSEIKISLAKYLMGSIDVHKKKVFLGHDECIEFINETVLNEEVRDITKSELNKTIRIFFNAAGKEANTISYCLPLKEIEERVSEFNVIKEESNYGYNIDMISLNSVFDFYNVPFNAKEFKEKYASRLHGTLVKNDTSISFLWDGQTLGGFDSDKCGNVNFINESIKIDESIDTTSFEYTAIAEGIQRYLNKNGRNDLILTELIEKCEEFEVVIKLRGTKIFSSKFNIDMISLESLCSFYNVKFNKDEIKKDISMNLGSSITPRNDIEFVNKRATEYLRMGRSGRYRNPDVSHITNVRPIKSKVHFINENSFFEKGQLDSIYVLVDKIRNDNKNLDFIRSLHPTIGKNIWSGNKVINFIYDDKNFKIQTNTSQQYYTISINDVIIVDQVDSNKSYEISKSLYKLLLRYTRTKFYTWYSYFIRYLEVHLKITRTEIYEKIEEFEILKYDKIDFISLESLFDYYDVKFSKDEMLKWFKDYADKVDLTELVLNESVVTNYIYDEIISYLEEDSFLLTDKLKIVDQILPGKFQKIDKMGTQYQFKYNNQLYQVGDLPNFCVVNTTTRNKTIGITKETASKLIDLLFESKSRREWINNVISHISPSNDLDLIKDIKHRMIEFDVVKDGVIDLITLNQVFDYYGKGKRFDLKRLENSLDVYEINYIS